jgi:hypothetical protein
MSPYTESKHVEATQESTRQRIDEAAQQQAARRQSEGKSNAKVLAFPVSKQRRFIDRHLIICRSDTPEVAYRYLSGIVRRHKGQLERLGVDSERAANETAELARAFGLMPGNTAKAASQ